MLITSRFYPEQYLLRKATEYHKDLGFILVKGRSRRYLTQRITDTDFTDNITTFSDTLQNATLQLRNIEIAATEVGLLINKKKTEFMSFNLNGIFQSLSGFYLKEVTDYKYLGSHIENTAKDKNIRIGITWRVMNKMSQI